MALLKQTPGDGRRARFGRCISRVEFDRRWSNVLSLSRINISAVCTLDMLPVHPRQKSCSPVRETFKRSPLLPARLAAFRKPWQRNWCKRELGEDVPVITCMSRDKHTYCRPGNVLIDDRCVLDLPLSLSFLLCGTAAACAQRGLCWHRILACFRHDSCFTANATHATARTLTNSLSRAWLLRLLLSRQVVSGGRLGTRRWHFYPPHQRELIVGEAKGTATSGAADRRRRARGRGRRKGEAPEEGIASSWVSP